MDSTIRSHREFKAEETGTFVQNLSGQGEVVSLYSKAVNILDPDGLLVALVEDHAQMTALSIRFPALLQVSVSKSVAVKSRGKVTLGQVD